MQQQTLLAVLLLLLTALASVGGGMMPREPFMEDRVCEDGTDPVNDVCPEDDDHNEPFATTDTSEEEATPMSNGQITTTEVTEETQGKNEDFTNCDNKDVEGFTGSMYAGF